MSLTFFLRSQNTQLSGLRHLDAPLRPGEASQVAATAIAEEIRSHFRELERTRPNKQGWKRQHYWNEAAESVRTEPRLGQTTAVVIDKPGVALHRYGGTVRPVRARFLTIPTHEEAYGKRAREFDDLFVRDFEGTRFLVRKLPGGSLRLMYRLARSTKHEADPTVLPGDRELDRAGSRAIASRMTRVIQLRRLGRR